MTALIAIAALGVCLVVLARSRSVRVAYLLWQVDGTAEASECGENFLQLLLWSEKVENVPLQESVEWSRLNLPGEPQAFLYLGRLTGERYIASVYVIESNLEYIVLLRTDARGQLRGERIIWTKAVG